VVAPGQVVVDGDSTFRTREGNAIDVSVVRHFGGRDATGVATLRGMTLEDAQRSPLVRVAAGRAWLAIQQALATEPNTAYDAGQRGLEELGTDYRGKRNGKNVIDDTGQAVRIAESAAGRGDFPTAAAKLGEVLQARLELYVRAFEGKVE
jgi:hypothetical protein